MLLSSYFSKGDAEMEAFSIAPEGWSDCDSDELFGENDVQATPLDDTELSAFVNANKAATFCWSHI